MRAPPESLRPMTGAPFLSARSITLQIFSACASESEPPNTVKSCENTYTSRPSIRPWPVTTPSPRYFSSARPKSLARWVTNRSSSTNEPGSSSASSRSRAVSLPFSCCVLTRSAPPPSSDSARFCCSRSSFSRMLMEPKSRRTDAQTHRGKQQEGAGIPGPLTSVLLCASVRLALIVLLRGLLSCLVPRPARRCQHDPMVYRVHFEHLQLDGLPLFDGVRRILDVRDAELRHRHEALDVLAQVHHHALVHQAEHAAAHLGPDGIGLADAQPRVLLRLLQAQRDALVLGVHVQDQHLDLVAL